MTVDVEAQAHFWTFLKRAREVAEDAEEASLFEKARASAAELEKKVAVSGKMIHEKTVLRIEGRPPRSVADRGTAVGAFFLRVGASRARWGITPITGMTQTGPPPSAFFVGWSFAGALG